MRLPFYAEIVRREGGQKGLFDKRKGQRNQLTKGD